MVFCHKKQRSILNAFENSYSDDKARRLAYLFFDCRRSWDIYLGSRAFSAVSYMTNWPASHPVHHDCVRCSAKLNEWGFSYPVSCMLTLCRHQARIRHTHTHTHIDEDDATRLVQSTGSRITVEQHCALRTSSYRAHSKQGKWELVFFSHPFSGPLSRVAGGTSTHPLVQYRAASTNGEGNGQGRSDKEHSEQQIGSA